MGGPRDGDRIDVPNGPDGKPSDYLYFPVMQAPHMYEITDPNSGFPVYVYQWGAGSYWYNGERR